MKLLKALIFSLITLFVMSIALPACKSSRDYSKVKSGNSMGNKKDKNRHVWGK